MVKDKATPMIEAINAFFIVSMHMIFQGGIFFMF